MQGQTHVMINYQVLLQVKTIFFSVRLGPVRGQRSRDATEQLLTDTSVDALVEGQSLKPVGLALHFTTSKVQEEVVVFVNAVVREGKDDGALSQTERVYILPPWL